MQSQLDSSLRDGDQARVESKAGGDDLCWRPVV